MPAMAICSPVVKPLEVKPGAMAVVTVTVVPLSLAAVMVAAPTAGMADLLHVGRRSSALISSRNRGPWALYWLTPSPACRMTRLPGVNRPGVPL